MGYRILIVDDDTDLLEMLRLALRPLGYTVYTATTGEAAIEKAQRLRPDSIVLDLLLPGMNGYEVCEHLRHQPATADIPIIIITALPGDFPRLASLELQVQAFLNKPFPVQELVAQLPAVGSVLSIDH